MTDKHNFAAIRLTGTDARDFLQGQLTQDMDSLNPDNPLLTGWNNPKGRLITLVWALEWQDSIWLLLPTELRDSVATRLRMFVLRADVQLETPDTPVTLAAAQPRQKPDTSSNNSCISDCFYDDNGYTLIPRFGGALGLGQTLLEPDTDNWRRANVAAGMPVVWGATRDEFVPQMVNLDLLGGISFTKGCYVGQEVVARTHNLGRIKRRMYRLQTAGAPPSPGSSVLAADKTVGQVVDAVSTEDGADMLAVVRIESLDEALQLEDGAALQRVDIDYPVPESLQ